MRPNRLAVHGVQDEEDPGERRGKQKRSRYIDDMAAEDRDAEDEEEDEGEVCRHTEMSIYQMMFQKLHRT